MRVRKTSCALAMAGACLCHKYGCVTLAPTAIEEGGSWQGSHVSRQRASCLPFVSASCTGPAQPARRPGTAQHVAAHHAHSHLGWLERVVNGERDVQEEDASGVGRACGESRWLAVVQILLDDKGLAHSTDVTAVQRQEASHTPDGPTIVETHSYMLSPLGPAEQLHGGSRLISASSF